MSYSSTSSSSCSSVLEDAGLRGRIGRGRGRGRGRGALAVDVDVPTTSSGRGRGGRGRGRGKGRGKAVARRLEEENRAEQALHILETRKQRLRLALDTMSKDRMKEILVNAMEQNPGLILDIYEPATRQPGGYHPSEDVEAPSWCVCEKCRDMPTEPERLCCGKIPEQCISLMPDFRVLILDEAVLALARLYRRDILVFDDEEDIMKANRHAAYRQFILWQHGRLGVGNRMVIPSCCVWRIRDKYPDAYGQYKGFIPSRLV